MFQTTNEFSGTKLWLSWEPQEMARSMLIYDLSTLEMVGKGYNHEKTWQKAKGRIVPLEEIGKT